MAYLSRTAPNFASLAKRTLIATCAILSFGNLAQAQPATGGTETDITDSGETFRIHTFTADGTLTVSSTISGADALIVAGGGGGGTDQRRSGDGGGAGGGGAGGMVQLSNITISAGSNAITIGSGGAGATATDGVGQNGGNSTFSGNTAPGGGAGAGTSTTAPSIDLPATSGGSGGGGVHTVVATRPGGATDDATQGNAGGTAPSTTGVNAGGGGAGGAGTAISSLTSVEGGGAGLASSISGSSVTYAAGGNGAGGEADTVRGGTAGAANTGNGGDGGNYTDGGAGGSGIVIVRYEIAEVSVSTITASASEADGGSGVDGVVRITLSSALANDVIVPYTVGGTATNGSDYATLTGSVTISAGSTSADITIDVTDDSVSESSETVTITLGGAVSAGPATMAAGNSTQTITIAKSDPAPTNFTIDAGNSQTVVAGSAVPTAPSVLVTDADNDPIPGVSVTFAVASGGGSITGGSATTDASGIATVGSWTLGTTAGANTLTASVSGLTDVTFSATGTVGTASILAISAGDGQTALPSTAVTTAPAVLVTDANGNPVSGISVTFAVASGGGSITGGSATTDASGVATVGGWTLGAELGENTLTASVSSPFTADVTFTATASQTLATPAGAQAASAAQAQSALFNMGQRASFARNRLLGTVSTQPGFAIITQRCKGTEIAALNEAKNETKEECSNPRTTWASLDLTQTQFSGALDGDGLQTMVTFGRDLVARDDMISGVTLSLERGDWDFTGEPDIEKTGFGVGGYAAMRRGALLLSGALDVTVLQNSLTNTDGATAEADSQRTAVSLSVSRPVEMANGNTVLPFAEVSMAREEMDGFTYTSGDSVNSFTTEAGEVSLWVQVFRPKTDSGVTLSFGAAISSPLGTETVTLSDGSLYEIAESETAEISFGMSRDMNEDTVLGLSINAAGIGGDETEHVSVTGTLDRKY